MPSKTPSLIEKLPANSRTQTLRKAVIEHYKDIKDCDAHKGVLISYSDNGMMMWSMHGVSHHEAVGLLEQAKNNILEGC